MTEGGCLCGAVRYQGQGQPSTSMIYHYQTCRRAAGAPVVAWLTFAIDQVTIVRGTPTAFCSSPPVDRTFCSLCGTLTYVHADRPAEVVDVTICMFDDPAAFPPSHHSWVSRDPQWLYFDDELPAYSATSTVS